MVYTFERHIVSVLLTTPQCILLNNLLRKRWIYTLRKFSFSFGWYGHPTEPKIYWLVNTLEKTGSSEGGRQYQHACLAWALDNIAAVSESVCQVSNNSTTIRSQWHHFTPYFTHWFPLPFLQNEPVNHQQRYVFCELKTWKGRHRQKCSFLMNK